MIVYVGVANVDGEWWYEGAMSVDVGSSLGYWILVVTGEEEQHVGDDESRPHILREILSNMWMWLVEEGGPFGCGAGDCNLGKRQRSNIVVVSEEEEGSSCWCWMCWAVGLCGERAKGVGGPGWWQVGGGGCGMDGDFGWGRRREREMPGGWLRWASSVAGGCGLYMLSLGRWWWVVCLSQR
ncbi:unnamed protein product [Ilex paraguariensis]|uniref:Uncharacterized protein n=1 Tax=Ilex paraguariensis TaxID=185542 RepID=A0ABC8UEW8_9AQUA